MSAQKDDWEDIKITPSFIDETAKKFGLSKSSGTRSIQHNRAVGGALHSYHLKGQAGDYVGSRESKQRFYHYLKDNYGYELKELLDEGDHIHVASPQQNKDEWEDVTPSTTKSSIAITKNKKPFNLFPQQKSEFNILSIPSTDTLAKRIARKSAIQLESFERADKEKPAKLKSKAKPVGADTLIRGGMSFTEPSGFVSNLEMEEINKQNAAEFSARYGTGFKGGTLYSLDVLTRPFQHLSTFVSGTMRGVGAHINAMVDPSNKSLQEQANNYNLLTVMDAAAERFYTGKTREGFEQPVEKLTELAIQKYGGDPQSAVNQLIISTLGGATDPISYLAPEELSHRLGIIKTTNIPKLIKGKPSPPEKSFTISKVNQEGTKQFYSIVNPKGEHIGSLHIDVPEGSTVGRIDWMEAGQLGGTENALGPKAIKDLMRAVKKEHPQLIEVEGLRHSGIRGKEIGPEKNIRIKLPDESKVLLNRLSQKGQINDVKVESGGDKQSITTFDDENKTIVINKDKLDTADPAHADAQLNEGIGHERGHAAIDARDPATITAFKESLDNQVQRRLIKGKTAKRIKQELDNPEKPHTRPDGEAGKAEERFVEDFTNTGQGVKRSDNIIEGERNAKTVRSDQGELSSTRPTTEGSETASGDDLYKARQGEAGQEGSQQASETATPSQGLGGKDDFADIDEGEQLATGIKKAQIAKERSERNLAPIEQAAVKSLPEMQTAGKAIAEAPNFREQVQKWAFDDNVELNDNEQAALIHDRLELTKQHDTLHSLYQDALENGEVGDAARLRTELSKLEDLLDYNDRASIKTGTTWGRAGRVRQQILAEDGSFTNQLQKARTANGGEEVSEAIREKIATKAKELNEVANDIEKHSEKQIAHEAKKAVDKIKKETKDRFQQRREQRIKTKEELAAEWTKLQEELSIATRKAMSSTHMTINADMAKAMAKMTRNLVERGIIELEDIIDNIYNHVSQIAPDISRREIMESLSGYGKDSRPTQNALAAQLAELRQAIRLTLAIEDAESGIPPITKGKTIKKPSARIAALKQQLADTLKAQGLDKEATPRTVSEATKLKAYKTKLENSIKDIEDRIARRDFSPKPKKTLVLDAEAMRLKERYARLRDEQDRIIEQVRRENRSSGEKALDFIVGWARGLKLSGLSTLLIKLPSAAVETMFFHNAYQTVGEVIHHTPWLKKLSKGASVEGGGFGIKAEAARFRQFIEAFTNEGKEVGGLIKPAGENWTEILKTGKISIDTLYGKKHVAIDPDIAGFFGHLHAIVKTIPKRGGFYAAVERGAKWALDNNFDIHDPAVQAKIFADAYEYANRQVFLEDNTLIKGFNNMVGWFEKQGMTGKITSAAIRFELPIVKVPTNIVKQSLLHIGGIPKAVIQLIAKRGIDNLSPAEKNAVMRAFKVGTVGAGMQLLGYLNYKNVGGFYQPGERPKGDVRAGGARIFNVEIPALLLHHPAFIAMQFGATIHRIQNHYSGKGPKEGESLPFSVMKSGEQLISETPLFDWEARTSQAFESSKTLNRFAANQITGAVLPADIPKMTKAADYPPGSNFLKSYIYNDTTPRDAKTFWQNIELELPWLRPQVKVNEKLLHRRFGYVEGKQ